MKVTATLKKVGTAIADAAERSAEREREYVSQDQFHAMNYSEAAALDHLRRRGHDAFWCPLCKDSSYTR